MTTLLWGIAVGFVISAVWLHASVASVLTSLAIWALFFILSVLWDEWRDPATSYTLRGR